MQALDETCRRREEENGGMEREQAEGARKVTGLLSGLSSV
jgi:hypothetical protein